MEKIEKEKYLAAKIAVDEIQSGMIVGLGTGSTAEIAIKILGEKVQSGLVITGVPTSLATAQLAKEQKINLIETAVPLKIDITIDGTDEFDTNLNLIKGGGGALLHEKIVASASEKVIIMADSRKKKQFFEFPLPVEVIPFACPLVMEKLKNLGGIPVLRKTKDHNIFISQEGNYIIDCKFALIKEPAELAMKINMIPGVVENGFFIGIADEVIFVSDDVVERIKK